MKITVHVRPNARREGVEKQADGSYKVSVNAPPQEGKANAAVIAALAGHFQVPKSSVRITHGLSGKKKLIEIG